MAKARALVPDLFAVAAVRTPAQVQPPPRPEPPAAPARAPTHQPEAATAAEDTDAAFSAIAGAMRGWTIAWPGQYAGASFANARHVRAVLTALRADGVLPGVPARPDARPLLRQVLQAMELGHVVLRAEMGVVGQREFDAWKAAAIAATEGTGDGH